MKLDLRSILTMNDGRAIPRLGLGVFRSAAGDETRRAVRWALEAGYRHVDTARIYGNEQDVGEALRESGVPRAEVFVTTKLWNTDQGYESALRACRESLKLLGLDYLDLYLIHWPVEGKRLDSWRALAKLKEDGLCRSIGVSNYMPSHLGELLERSQVVPQVNQVEMSPFLGQAALREMCARHRIVVEAYSPLTKGRRLAHPELVRIAGARGRTTAQVLLRWALQKDVVVIPKSARRERIVENASIFDFALTEEEMRALDRLDEGLHTGWDPTNAP